MIWGVCVGDLDNDGNPDIFCVTGGIYPELRDNYLYARESFFAILARGGLKN